MTTAEPGLANLAFRCRAHHPLDPVRRTRQIGGQHLVTTRRHQDDIFRRESPAAFRDLERRLSATT